MMNNYFFQTDMT